MNGRRRLRLAAACAFTLAASCSSASHSTSASGSSSTSVGAVTADSAAGNTETAPAVTGAASPETTGGALASAPADELAFGPGLFDLPDPTVGLSALGSYRATLTISFDGTKDGQPDSWTLTRSVMSSHDPAVRQLTEEQTGSAPHLRFEADIAGARYERLDQGACATTLLAADGATDADAELGDGSRRDSDSADPVALLPSLCGAEESGSEEIDGVPTTHFVFDERALGSLDPATSTGEMWVATTGGYVSRYTLVTQGNSAALGAGTEGRLSLDYSVTAIDQPAAVEVPADCPTGLIDVQLQPDAADVSRAPGVIRYTTSTTPVDVAEFFADQLVAAGWQSAGAALIGVTGTSSAFTRQAESLTINARITTPGTGAATVTIVSGDVLP